MHGMKTIKPTSASWYRWKMSIIIQMDFTSCCSDILKLIWKISGDGEKTCKKLLIPISRLNNWTNMHCKVEFKINSETVCWLMLEEHKRRVETNTQWEYVKFYKHSGICLLMSYRTIWRLLRCRKYGHGRRGQTIIWWRQKKRMRLEKWQRFEKLKRNWKLHFNDVNLEANCFALCRNKV